MSENILYVRGRFWIGDANEEPQFRGWFRPDMRWNGWVCPLLDDDEVRRFMEAYADEYTYDVGDNEIIMKHAASDTELVMFRTTVWIPESRKRLWDASAGLCWQGKAHTDRRTPPDPAKRVYEVELYRWVRSTTVVALVSESPEDAHRLAHSACVLQGWDGYVELTEPNEDISVAEHERRHRDDLEDSDARI